ncbi:MAG: electron transfer flavoprotein subunit alpha/FixB family protein [Deltaproteobacteria bacterium]|nr:electron transfer flavoprotein subunit alpha/FixB family protein [Deltaproteobacteria bacterium]
MGKGVLAFAEQVDGSFRKIAYEVVSEARRLADILQGPLTAVVMGSGVEEIAAELKAYGVDCIVIADDAALTDYTTEAYTRVLSGIVKDKAPEIILLGASTRGKDLAARLAAHLDAGLAMDCIALSLDNSALHATRPMFGGKILADVVIEKAPKIAALRPNVAEVTEASGAGELEKAPVEVGQTKTRVVEKKVETTGVVDLTEADIVVSGGRGMGGADFSVIEALAQELGAAVGASRSAVDEGWRPHSDQVGQTGKVVSPSLYIACGISGAIQHLAGMGSSKYIVAINKDPEAPIFKKADYGIVEDLFKVVPAITAEIKKLKG